MGEPVFDFDIRTSAETLGKVYAVMSKRRAKIVFEDMNEGTSVFTIKGILPVVESFGFGDEVQKKSSGATSVQLEFSKFVEMNVDPFFVAKTEEEIEEFGEENVGVPPNLARKLIDDVRRRKGLFVEEKLVEHAEKQRTL